MEGHDSRSYGFGRVSEVAQNVPAPVSMLAWKTSFDMTEHNVGVPEPGQHDLQSSTDKFNSKLAIVNHVKKVDWTIPEQSEVEQPEELVQTELEFQRQLVTEFNQASDSGVDQDEHDDDSYVNILSEVGDVLSSCVRRATLRVDQNANAASSDYDPEDSLMLPRVH